MSEKSLILDHIIFKPSRIADTCGERRRINAQLLSTAERNEKLYFYCHRRRVRLKRQLQIIIYRERRTRVSSIPCP